MRRFLGFLIVVELLAAGAYFGGPPAKEWLDERTGSPTVQAGPTGTEPPSTRLVEVPRPGQSIVSGTLTRLVAKDAAGDAIPAPFTIQPGQVGVSRAVIGNVLVDGKPSTIAWDGGRPLPITGTGALELGTTQVTVDPASVTWALEGSARALRPGAYRANFTVAVGSAGVANVRDNVAFTAGNDAALEVRKGTAFVRLPAAPLHVRAVQPTMATLEGDLTVQTTAGDHKSRRVTFGPGLYDVTLTPVAGGYTLRAILQGPVQG